MIRQSRNLAAVKRAIQTCLRSKVDVTVNLGRNKVLSYRGELSGVYPASLHRAPRRRALLGQDELFLWRKCSAAASSKTRRIGSAAPTKRAGGTAVPPPLPPALNHVARKKQAAGRRPKGSAPPPLHTVFQANTPFPSNFCFIRIRRRESPFLIARLQKRLERNEKLSARPDMAYKAFAELDAEEDGKIFRLSLRHPAARDGEHGWNDPDRRSTYRNIRRPS